MMEQTMKGASDTGAETELIHLYDYDFKGYMSCFACKYDVMERTQAYRAKYRDEQLPKDLEAAYELGKRLVEKAEEAQHEA